MNRRLMKAGEKNYLKESNGTKANCNANVTQIESHAFTGGIIVTHKFPLFSLFFTKIQSSPLVFFYPIKQTNKNAIGVCMNTNTNI